MKEYFVRIADSDYVALRELIDDLEAADEHPMVIERITNPLRGEEAAYLAR